MSALSISETLLEGSRLLKTAGVPQSRREASSLLSYVTGYDVTFMIAHSEVEIEGKLLEEFKNVLRRRAAGEPLQYITGHQEFYGLDFETTPDVLIPRPETELLVEAALEIIRNEKLRGAPRICDIGTGSGCISIALLNSLREACAVGIDISFPALEVARRNARRHDVDERFKLLVSDCFSALGGKIPEFTMIVSNPPYVAQDNLPGLQREVRDYEPRVALTPGGDGLRVIRRLIGEAPDFLVEGGYLLFEIGFDQHHAVRQFVNSACWEILDIHKDIQGIPRTVALRRR